MDSNHLVDSLELNLDILEHLPDALAVIDRSMTHVRANRPLCELTGYSREALLAAKTPPYWTAEASRVLSPEVAGAFSGIRGAGLVTLRRGDGSTFQATVTLSPIPSDNDEVLACLATIREFEDTHAVETERRRAAETALVMLRAVSKATHLLYDSVSYESGMDRAIEMLGESAGVSRAYLFEFHEDENRRLLASQRFEWVAPGIAPQPQIVDLSVEELGFGRWVDILGRGEMIAGDVATFPEEERAFLSPQGIHSILIAPVTIDNQLWGFAGFDECEGTRRWSRAEQEAVSAGAEVIGGAIARRAATEELTATKLRHRLIMEEVPASIIYVDRDDILQHCNSQYAGRRGTSPEDIQGMRVRDLMDPSTYEVHQIHAERALAGELSRFEFVAEYESVGIRELEMAYVPHLDANRCPVGFYGLGIDVTDRNVAGKALKRSEVMWRSALENASDFIFLLCPSGRLVSFDGFTPTLDGHGMGGVRSHDFINAEYHEEWDGKLRNVVDAGVVESFEFPGRSPAKVPVWYRGKLCPIQGGDEVEYIMMIASDITAEKTAAEAIRKSEARFRRLYDSNAIGVFFADTSPLIHSANEEFLRIIGATTGDFPIDPNMITPPEWMPQTDRSIERVKKSGKALPIEKEFLRIDGGRVPVLVALASIDSGEGMVGIALDLTPQKRAEKAVQKSERLLVEAQRIARVGSWEWNVATGAMIWSKELYRVLGREESGESPSIETLRSLVHPSDLEQFSEKFENALGSFERCALTFRVVTGTNETRWIHCEGRAIRQLDGTPARAVGISRDITEQMESEQARLDSEARLARAEEISNIMICHSTLEGYWAKVPQSLCEFLGYSEEELLRHRFVDVTHPEDAKTDWENCERLLRGETRSFDMEKRFIRKDGSIVWAYLNSLMVTDEEDNPVHLLAYITDIDERKRAEEALLRSEQQLRASESELRELAERLQSAREQESSSLSREIHDELGQSLTVLKMDVAWIRRRMANEDNETSENRNEIENRLAEMSEQIDETVQAVRRIASRLRPRILDDVGILEALEWLAEDFESRTSVECHFHASPVTRAFKENQSIALYRILQEVLTNITRHSEATRVDVEIGMEGDAFFMNIFDNGRGFDVASPVSPRSLGLVGMRERLAVFGGTIGVSSTPGEGTVVSIYIGSEDLPEEGMP